MLQTADSLVPVVVVLTEYVGGDDGTMTSKTPPDNVLMSQDAPVTAILVVSVEVLLHDNAAWGKWLDDPETKANSKEVTFAVAF